MNSCMQYFACAFLLVYLGKGVLVAGEASTDNCWMKDAQDTKIIYSVLHDVKLDIIPSNTRHYTFKIVNPADKEKLPEVFDVGKNATSKYMRVVWNDKEKGLYDLKTTPAIAQYVIDEEKPTFQITIIYSCKISDEKVPYDKYVTVDVTVNNRDPPPEPTFLKPAETENELAIPMPLVKGVQVPGVELEVQFVSYNDLSIAFDPPGLFEVFSKEKKARRKYTVTLKAMQTINFSSATKITLIAKDAKNDTNEVRKPITLKVNENDSAPLLSGENYIDQRKCAKKGENIGDILYKRGNPDNVKFALAVVPNELKTHFGVGEFKDKKIPIFLKSCPEPKELEKTNVAVLTVTATSKEGTLDFTVPVVFSNSPSPTPNEGGGNGGLIAFLVIFILSSILGAATSFYFWRKVRNMSSSFP